MQPLSNEQRARLATMLRSEDARVRQQAFALLEGVGITVVPEFKEALGEMLVMEEEYRERLPLIDSGIGHIAASGMDEFGNIDSTATALLEEWKATYRACEKVLIRTTRDIDGAIAKLLAIRREPQP